MIKMVKLREEHLEMLLEWRTKDFVTRHMLTNINNNIESQRKWFEKISGNDQYKYWVIYYKSIPVGVVNLAEIDNDNLKCSAGYYIGNEDFKSLGAVILPYLYNYIFKNLGFRKVFGSVVADNVSILKIHQIHGYRNIGFYEKHIKKDGGFCDIILVELMAEVWLAKKKYAMYDAEWED